MTGKKALVILTNESFLPAEGKGSAPYAPISEALEDRSITSYAPSTWQSPITTTYAPSSEYPQTEMFETRHRPTGVDILEVGQLWFNLAKQENWEITFTTPRGGAVAIDPHSIKQLGKEFAERIWNDSSLMCKLNHTYPCAWINPKDYQIAIIPGSHASMLDLPHCKSVTSLISKVWENTGCVAAIGHGVAALLNVRESVSKKSGEYILKDRKITCFTREEEEKSQLEKFTPYSIEEKAKERGAKVLNGKPFESRVVVDESEDKCLITAQSYPSTREFIQSIIKYCRD